MNDATKLEHPSWLHLVSGWASVKGTRVHGYFFQTDDNRTVWFYSDQPVDGMHTHQASTAVGFEKDGGTKEDSTVESPTLSIEDGWKQLQELKTMVVRELRKINDWTTLKELDLAREYNITTDVRHVHSKVLATDEEDAKKTVLAKMQLKTGKSNDFLSHRTVEVVRQVAQEVTEK